MSITDDRPDFLVQNVAPKDERWVMECSIRAEREEVLGASRTKRTVEFNGYGMKDVVFEMLDMVKEVIA